MSIAGKLTLALALLALLAFGVVGWRQVNAETAALREVTESEVLLLGRGLRASLEHSIRDGQIEDATSLVNALTDVRPTVQLFVFGSAGTMLTMSPDAHLTDAAADLARQVASQPVTIVQYPRNETLMRVAMALTPSGALILERPLNDLESDIASTKRNIWGAALLFAIGLAFVVWFSARRYVGRPLEKLMEAMTQVQSGNLTLDEIPHSRDEVGKVIHAFAGLVEALHVERRRADAELDARTRLERGLQEADKLITLGRLSAVMAHEIGSPLQILEGRARELRKHADHPGMTARIADVMIEQTERVTRLISQLLSLTRRPTQRSLNIDAAAAVQSVVSLLEREAKRANVQIVQLGTAPCLVDANRDELQQVALNLLRNALAAAPRQSTITIRLSRDDKWFTLEVEDQGSGLDAAIREMVFEPFVTTKSAQGGTGLGLAVVRGIVTEHRGTATFVDPSQGIGCIVRIQLPVTRSESESSSP